MGESKLQQEKKVKDDFGISHLFRFKVKYGKNKKKDFQYVIKEHSATNLVFSRDFHKKHFLPAVREVIKFSTLLLTARQKIHISKYLNISKKNSNFIPTFNITLEKTKN